MKKVMLFAAAMVAAISLSAQSVTPISMKLTEYKLDSLRVEHANHPEALLAALLQIEVAQKQDADELKNLQKQLKDEKAFSKERASLLKESNKAMKSLQKNAQNSHKTLTSLRNRMEKSYRTIQKQSMLDAELKETTINSIMDHKDLIEKDIDVASSQINGFSKQESTIANNLANLTNFDAAVASKEVEYKNLETKHKANVAEIKAQIKAAKEAVKAAKK